MSDVLHSLLQNGKSALSDGFIRWRLEQEWVKIVGEGLAKQTIPCAYDRGVLFIHVQHAAWMQQLWYFQPQILEKVNAHLGREWAKEIRLTQSPRASVSAREAMSAKIKAASTSSGGSSNEKPLMPEIDPRDLNSEPEDS
jgi:predicted nucleic acid-binding Zn ribbon protein